MTKAQMHRTCSRVHLRRGCRECRVCCLVKRADQLGVSAFRDHVLVNQKTAGTVGSDASGAAFISALPVAGLSRGLAGLVTLLLRLMTSVSVARHQP